MVLKSSWIVIAAIFLGQQASVLSAPFDRNCQPENGDYPPKGKYDSKPYWGSKPPSHSDHTSTGDSPFLTDIPEHHGQDSLGDYPKKGDHGSISDPSFRDPYSGCTDDDNVHYPDTKPYPGGKNSVVTDPTFTEEPYSSAPSPVHHRGGDSYGKRTTKPANGTISDPTFTKDHRIPKPVEHDGGDSYGKRLTKEANGTISDPSFTDDPWNKTSYPVDSFYKGKGSKKSPDGTISDPTYTEDPISRNTYPMVDYYHSKDPSEEVRGTISDAEGRRGHTPTGKPCIVPSSGYNHILPYGDDNPSHLEGKELTCYPDEIEESASQDASKEPRPYDFMDGDDTDRSI